MSTLLYGMLAEAGPQADETVYRRQADPIDLGKQPAEQQGAPEYGEVETDQDTNLAFAGRQLASDWHQGEQFAPSWTGEVAQVADSAHRINGQVSSSGTAAARETAGQFGHGTYRYAVGVEPVIREGATFGERYFAADRDMIMADSNPESGIAPSSADGLSLDVASARYTDQSRRAAEAEMYASYWDGVLNG